MNMPDINSLLESLSDDDISALGDMVQQLSGSSAPESTAQGDGLLGGIDPTMIAKLMQIMPMLQSGGDNDRTRLICALKPMLSKPRRRKADEAMQIMRLMEILPMINLFNS
ncbi:MAG: hypothetical protein IJ261_02040 [Clostridia bacterium]|nr:hypothetical protein [Clostridia bacterium]